MRLTILFLFVMGSIASAASHDTIDRLKEELEQHPDMDTARVNLLNQLGYYYWIVDPVQSELYGKEALQLADTLSYLQGEAYACRIVGVAHWARGQYVKAQEYLFDGLKLYQQLDDTLNVAKVFNNLGLVYFDQRSYELSITYFEEARSRYQAMNSQRQEMAVLSNMGKAHMRTGNYSRAKQIFTEKLAKELKGQSPYGTATAYSNLGELYLALEQLPKALEHFEQSLHIREKISDLEGMAMCLAFIGQIHTTMQEYALAEHYLLQGIDTALKVNARKWLTEMYGTLKNLKVAQGQYPQALAYSDQYIAQKDSLFDIEKSRQITEMQARYETRQKEQQLEVQKKELEIFRQKSAIQQLIRNGLLAGFIILLVVGYLVVSRQKLKIKKNRELLVKNRQIYHSQQTVTQVELENARLKQQELANEVEFKNKELTSYTISFIQKNELLEELKGNIEKIKKPQDKETIRQLKGLVRLVESNMYLDKDWEDFKLRFEDVHKDFFKMLKEKYPDLTNNELRLCALLKLNMNMKEAASILGISPESVKTARYRLRKKLHLNREENLIGHIIHLEETLFKPLNQQDSF